MTDGTAFTAPMTRAQKFQWYLEKGLAEGLRPLPEPTTEASARSLVRALQERFEILRTSLEVVDGELRQRVHGSGPAPELVEVGPAATVQARMAGLVGEFTAEEHGRVGRFLARFHLLTQDQRWWLGITADNVAMDAGFHRRLDEVTTGLLAAGPDRPRDAPEVEGLQPAETARREAGPQGEAERTRAGDLLRAHFGTAAPRLHPHRPSSGRNEGRYYRCTLTLPGADALFARVVSGTGLLPSALVLAAFAQLMCWRSEADACSVNVSLDNRHSAELRQVLCATAQRAPVELRRQDRGLVAAAEDVQEVLAEGYPDHGRYDPFDLIGERVRAQHRRGVCLSTDLAFNFVPPPLGWTDLLASAGDRTVAPAGAPAEIRRETTDEVAYEYGASLSVRWADPRTVRLSVHGDSEVLAPEQCAALLRAIAQVLERVAADQDCAVGETARAAGLTRLPRAANGLRVDGRWIDLGAIADRLAAVDAVERAELLVTGDDAAGRPRLTARVRLADGATTTPLDLREELLRAVGTGELLTVPDRYEIVGGAGGDGRTGARRPAATAAERALQEALAGSRLVQEADLDLCYVRAGGRLDRYPEFAERLRRRGYLLPGFARVSGMETLRALARDLPRIEPGTG